MVTLKAGKRSNSVPYMGKKEDKPQKPIGLIIRASPLFFFKIFEGTT